ncbi:hypothetical protein, partial [Chryseobacterium sp. SIMBA_029]|uniref:hypothetical protein n=1 Tax=Chryseobacterium sp. SIMBA_029 TaxID=3085772 RepID=UPI003978A3BD
AAVLFCLRRLCAYGVGTQQGKANAAGTQKDRTAKGKKTRISIVDLSTENVRKSVHNYLANPASH